jgi:hypothetical protein
MNLPSPVLWTWTVVTTLLYGCAGPIHDGAGALEAPASLLPALLPSSFAAPTGYRNSDRLPRS